MLRSAVFLMVLVFALAGQTPPVFRISVRTVAVPVVVRDFEGRLVRGLNAADFELFDNDRPQVVRLDDTGEHFSIAIAVQINRAVEAWLPHVRRVGNVVDDLLAGAQGSTNLIAFSDEVNVIHRLADLKAEGDKSRCLDAVMSAVALLRQSPAGSRRVILLIGQTGDYGSSARLRDVLRALELNNIAVYTAAMPRAGKELLGSFRLSGVPQEGGGIVAKADLMKLVPEIYRGAKSAAREDAVSVMTDYLGGTRIPFRNLRELEAGISAIGEELHTGYVLSYTPDRADGGYHRIRVITPGRALNVRARSGYYVTAE